jgi:uncharacterized protein (DUF885 family)
VESLGSRAMRTAILAALAFMLAAPAVRAQELSAEDLDRRRVALAKLLDEQWDDTMRTYPQYASLLGDKRFNDRVDDESEKAALARVAKEKEFLRRFEAISPRAFSEQERLNRDLMIRGLRESVEDARFRGWLMPVNQMSGFHLRLPQLPSLLQFATVKDYDDYEKRMRKAPRQFDDVIANMRKGMAAKLMPPRFLLEKVAQQAEDIAKSAPEESPFGRPLASFPDSIPESERQRIRAAWLDAIRTDVLPGFARFAKFVRDEYAPRGRAEFGVWALPDGADRYATAVKRMTSTDLTPREVHDIGVREVARIEAEMLDIAKRLGHADLESFKAAVEANPDLRAKSGDQILGLYRKFIDQMAAKLPQMFGRLPKAPVVVLPTESYREKQSASADYDSPAPDGSRPGRINVNTYDPASRKTIFMESTAYHEGVPGHHMQIAIAQELTDLPMFRRQSIDTAYVEGWALYSERLGKEVGFYEDPYNDYGRLNDEMLRAIRLVVDTGLHDKRWSRDQVVQYFRDHSSLDEVEIQSETDRYIVWPGQATAYKIGQLTILRLRERAQRELGAKFDIRAFHDEVLGAGSLPMGVLEERIERWIGRSR